MKLVYNVNDKPPFGKNLLFAVQQFLAIIAATILVPLLVNINSGTSYLSQPAALIGAGFGTLVYLLFTRFKSPVFLGSSFAFITPLVSAVSFGYFGVMLGALFAGLVYVIIAIVVMKVGSDWINKLMPPVIIGPTVALIGLDLSGSAIDNVMNISASPNNYNLISIAIAIITFLVVVIASVKGGKSLKMFPFIIGVLGGYAVAAIVTAIGFYGFGSEYCHLIDFTPFTKIGDFKNWLPDITFIGIFKEGIVDNFNFTSVVTLFVAFAPVALVTFAEHVADHKNISSIIEHDLLADPGLHNTLLGDGVGSIVGAAFGGCPNTTYGESIGCVAITGNASVSTILITAIICIVIAFFYPVMAFVETIPNCVVGGICIALYGFIAVSGLRMFKNVDLDNSKNLFIVAAILVTGIGGLNITIPVGAGTIVISNIACALILGIVVNLILKPADVDVEKKVTLKKDEEFEEDMFGKTVKEKK